MEFFYEYGMFLLQAVTIVLAIGAVVAVIATASRGDEKSGGLKIENLNDKYRDMANALRKAVLSKSQWKEVEKQQKKAAKDAGKKADDEQKKRVFVLEFKGDIRATAVESLREEVSAVVSVAGQNDEVVVCIENAGGAVQDHGLGASQLQRIRDHGIPLTVIVDKVAASGGYLMAALADRFVAAPFAIIGSIGVLAQIPNFHRFLEDRGIDFEQITAGKYKRTLTMFGKNTEADREKTREELEEVHTLFKNAVSEHRPSMDIESVATGEHWYGTRALELGLIDELGSSDDYLMKAADDADIYSVTWKAQQSFIQKLQGAMTAALAAVGFETRPPLG
ncbi:MAG: protease SohB [Gammaproteobacteria bacterium]|nr:protease SohB [Gammaproteobacteria bacterium]NND54111.1 protease SohB [Gammaproteobacteria bacterium]